jgi:hypothetical protein
MHISYRRQWENTSVEIRATISDGQVVTKTVTIKNIKIALSVIPKKNIKVSLILTEIFVGVVSPNQFNNSKTVYVKQPKTTISVNNMYDGGTKVKGYVTNVNKGDYILIKSSGISKKIKVLL